MNRLLLPLALTLAVSAVYAQSAAVSGPAGARHEQMRAKAEARFREADGNHDGLISFAEMQAASQQRLKERFEKLDANHDGGVSMAEMQQAHQQRREMRGEHRERRQAMREKLQSLDRDHDQALSRQELGNEMPKLAENFDRIDANHDGKLTREEMRAAHRMNHPEQSQVPR
jgi:Ca2+-binding EF-hand superfamily protein